ncbi:MAG: glycosyltransferase family 61 protein [Desulfovibrio sp.]|nr:glycosyltransferase family 61 protein [Desulfovibrio sp.]
MPPVSVSESLVAGLLHGSEHSLDGYGIKYSVLDNVMCDGHPYSFLLCNVSGDWRCIEDADRYRDDIRRHFARTAFHSGKNLEVVGEAAALSTLYCDDIVHWITEFIPRLLLLEQAGFRGKYVISCKAAFVTDYLDLLGISPERLLHNERPYYIQKLWHIQDVDPGGRAEEQKLLRLIRERVLGAFAREPAGSPKRVYLRQTRGQKVANEDELQAVLAPYGFTAIAGDTMPVREAIDVFRRAECLLAPHGTGNVYSLFMQEGGVFIDLFGNGRVKPDLLAAARLLGLRYYPVPEAAGHTPCRGGTDVCAADRADINVCTDFIETILSGLYGRGSDASAGAFEILESNGETLALILRNCYSQDGIAFFTPETFSQQLGYMRRPGGYRIAPHDHNPLPRTIEWTQEVLFIKSGRVRLDLYAPASRNYLESRILHPGDLALLAHGGHGLVMLEQSEIIEVKQGPYAGEADKTRFTPVDDKRVSCRE